MIRASDFVCRQCKQAGHVLACHADDSFTIECRPCQRTWRVQADWL